MLVYIDKTIGDYCETGGLNEDEKILFAELAVAHQHGNCLLCGDLKSIEWLIKSLEGIHSAIYKQIRNKHTEVRSIVDEIETALVIYYDQQPLPPSFFAGKYRAINVRDALNYRLSLQCSLVAENLEDCTFYELVAKRFMYEKKLKGINLSFHYELGGGDTINTVFQKCVEKDKVLTLCLVDSDIKYGPTKKYPDSPARGVTVKKLEATYKNLKRKITDSTYELYCLPVHEVENLIPLSVLESIAKSTVPEMNNGVIYLRKLLAANLQKAILCYDFKNGGNKVKDDPSVTYWIEIAELIGDDTFPILCAKVLEKAIEVLQGNTSDSQNQISCVYIDSYLLSLWEEIGVKVLSWGCANQPIRS